MHIFPIFALATSYFRTYDVNNNASFVMSIKVNSIIILFSNCLLQSVILENCTIESGRFSSFVIAKRLYISTCIFQNISLVSSYPI